MIDLVKARVEVAEATMMNNLSLDVYSDGTADGGKQINGLQALVSTGPNTGMVGAINRSSYAFWRNQLETGTAALTSSTIVPAMNQLWVKQVRNMDKPDLIASGNGFYTAYLESLQDNQRFTDKKTAGAGFQNVMFISAPVVLDGGLGGACPTDRMYFLNCKYLHWRPHSDRNMVPISPDRHSTNQDATIKLIGWAGNLTMSNASLQGVLRNP